MHAQTRSQTSYHRRSMQICYRKACKSHLLYLPLFLADALLIGESQIILDINFLHFVRTPTYSY